MANYQLSELAASDLDALYLYGITQYGMQQADGYFDDLVDKFDTLYHHPDWGSDYAFITPDLQRYEYGSHSIYYQHKGDVVLIVRILGCRQDPARYI